MEQVGGLVHPLTDKKFYFLNCVIIHEAPFHYMKVATVLAVHRSPQLARHTYILTHTQGHTHTLTDTRRREDKRRERRTSIVVYLKKSSLDSCIYCKCILGP